MYRILHRAISHVASEAATYEIHRTTTKVGYFSAWKVVTIGPFKPRFFLIQNLYFNEGKKNIYLHSSFALYLQLILAQLYHVCVNEHSDRRREKVQEVRGDYQWLRLSIPNYEREPYLIEVRATASGSLCFLFFLFYCH